MDNLSRLMEQYSDDFLIVDGKMPFVTSGTVLEEAMMFDLNELTRRKIYAQLHEQLNIQIDDLTVATNFSFGQKIIVAIYFAINSSSDKILLSSVWEPINIANRRIIENEIEQFTSIKVIKIIDQV